MSHQSGDDSGSGWRSVVTTWCGVGAVAGAVCWTGTSLLVPVVLGTRPYEATAFDVLKLVGWTLMMGGLLGVPVALGDHVRRLGRAGVGVTALGMVLVAGLQVRAVVVFVAAGFQAVPATGENPIVLLAAYVGYTLSIGGGGLLAVSLWRSPDRQVVTIVFLVAAVVIPGVVLLPFGVLPTTLRTLFLRSNNLLVPFGVAWVALGIFVHQRRAR